MIVVHVTYIKGKVATNLKLIVVTNMKRIIGTNIKVILIYQDNKKLIIEKGN